MTAGEGAAIMGKATKKYTVLNCIALFWLQIVVVFW